MRGHSQLLQEELWLSEEVLRPDQVVSIQNSRNHHVCVTNSVLPQVVLVRRSHWPGLELLIGFEVVPCLTAINILHSPSHVIRLELQVVILFEVAICCAICRAVSRAIGLLVVSSPPDSHVGVPRQSVLLEVFRQIVVFVLHLSIGTSDG
jgi:hypothetical protein